MRLHDRAVDEVEAVVRFRRQGIENLLPDATPGPPIEAVVDRRVRPVTLRQIPPRHAGAQNVKYPIQDLAIVDP